MQKKGLKLISVILVLFLVLTGCSAARTDNESDDSVESSNRRKVKTETIPLKHRDFTLKIEFFRDRNLPLEQGAPYNTFDVYQVKGKKKEKVYTFNNKESFEKQQYFTGYEVIEGQEDLEGTIVLTMEDAVMGLTSILVLGLDDNDAFIEKYFDEYELEYGFKDVNQDGTTELLVGSSNGGGYVSWWNGFMIAHALAEGYYKPSYELTHQHYQNLIDSREEAFLGKYTENALKELIDACVWMGDELKVRKLLLQHPDLADALDKTFPKGELPGDSYCDFVSYQAGSYKDYWDLIFSGDPSYEQDKKDNPAVQQDALSDPFLIYIKSMNDTDEILYDIRQDIDRDGYEEAVIAIGQDDYIKSLYVLRNRDGFIEQLGENLADTGYGIYEVKLVKLQDMPQGYVYCGLTNGAALSGFMLFELKGNSIETICYSASATGSGDDVLEDRDQDGAYDGYTQYRSSYDVLYYSMAIVYSWQNGQFVLSKTHADIPEYPKEIKEVIIQFLSLRLLDDGSSDEIKKRLNELCTTEDWQNTTLGGDWYYGVMNTLIFMDDTIKFIIAENDKTAVVTAKCRAEDGNELSLIFNLVRMDGLWRIDSIH